MSSSARTSIASGEASWRGTAGGTNPIAQAYDAPATVIANSAWASVCLEPA
jgi:hypothetical protein